MQVPQWGGNFSQGFVRLDFTKFWLSGAIGGVLRSGPLHVASW